MYVKIVVTSDAIDGGDTYPSEIWECKRVLVTHTWDNDEPQLSVEITGDDGKSTTLGLGAHLEPVVYVLNDDGKTIDKFKL